MEDKLHDESQGNRLLRRLQLSINEKLHRCMPRSSPVLLLGEGPMVGCCRKSALTIDLALIQRDRVVTVRSVASA
jgi:hypothetical protein